MSRFHNRNFELLEPYDAKVSRTVLRGEGSSNAPDLLDIFWTILPKHSSSSRNVPGTCNRCPGIAAPIRRNGTYYPALDPTLSGSRVIWVVL